MSETLKQKVHDYCHGHVQFGSLFTDVLSIIADHVDAMSTRIDQVVDYYNGMFERVDKLEKAIVKNRADSLVDAEIRLNRHNEIIRRMDVLLDRIHELESFTEGLESRINAQDEHEAELKRDFDTAFGELETYVCDLREKLNSEALDLRGRCLQNRSILKALERDFATHAGADVPSSEGVDLEGEAMTADYNAMRDDADDERPWREAAEACWSRVYGSWTGGRSDASVVNVIESAIEKAVGQAASSVFSVSACNQKLVQERDALKAEVEQLKAAKPKVVRIIPPTAELEQMLKEAGLSHWGDENVACVAVNLTRELSKCGVEQAKPKVVMLTKDEIEGCFLHRKKQGEPLTIGDSIAVDAILELQQRKAAEIEGGR